MRLVFVLNMSSSLNKDIIIIIDRNYICIYRKKKKQSSVVCLLEFMLYVQANN